jgi:hypothetical protein
MALARRVGLYKNNVFREQNPEPGSYKLRPRDAVARFALDRAAIVPPAGPADLGRTHDGHR